MREPERKSIATKSRTLPQNKHFTKLNRMLAKSTTKKTEQKTLHIFASYTYQNSQ